MKNRMEKKYQAFGRRIGGQIYEEFVDPRVIVIFCTNLLQGAAYNIPDKFADPDKVSEFQVKLQSIVDELLQPT